MSFLFNLFSPKGQKAADSEEEMDDPLSRFFAATADNVDAGEIPGNADDDAINVPYHQWKKTQREHLLNFLQHRLIGDETGNEPPIESSKQEEDSFCSDILDEEFDASQQHEDGNAATAMDDDDDDGSEEERELETQPLTQFFTPRFFTNASGDKSKSGKSSKSNKSTDKSNISNASINRGFISGIKRKLGFGVEQNSYSEDAASQKKRRIDSANNNNTDKIIDKDSGKGIKIPHISNATHQTTQLSEMDLHTSRLDVELGQIVKIWRLRDTKRMAYHISSTSNNNSQESQQTIDVNTYDCHWNTNYQSYQNDGPLHSIYKTVLCLEVVQLQISTPSLVMNLPISSEPLQKKRERKQRHEIKRVHIFLYNKYADRVSRLLNDKKKYLVSLRDVPSHCIMPMESTRKIDRYIRNPFGDEEYGALSPYCICIGDDCSLKFGGERLYFDDDSLEIRLVEMPAEICFDFKADGIVSGKTVRVGGEGYYWGEGVLMKRYAEYRGWTQKKRGMTILLGDDDAEAAAPRKSAENGDESCADEALDENNASQDSSAGEGTHSGEKVQGVDSDTICRPNSVKPLSVLLPLLHESGNKRIKDITIYGVVLGYSPPSLTTTKEWKMSMVVMDETLPITTEQNQQSGGCPQSLNEDNKKVHVPSITIVLFVKNKSHLPVIRSAGDVVCCRNATLQEYNHEPQLLCNRRSSVLVVRPSLMRSPGRVLHDSISANDWSLSCSCHEDSERNAHPLDWRLVNSLWRWGQRRLSLHPTMSPNCKISIAGLDRAVENVEVTVSGDLTAVVTAILPLPDHLRRRDTARGYIRLWDGSGPPRCDP
jgi:hypothetical protein